MIRKHNNLSIFFVVMSMLLLTTVSAFAGNFTLKYEKVVTDSYGNELGYQTVTVTDIKKLPAQWQEYLNLKLDSGKTIYEYASSISSSLNKDFTLTISDRDCNSYSYKNNSSYCVNIFNYVNNYSTDSSKKFLFLHEFGHSTMLNSYPANYDFNNLDYGTDGSHYLDEVLPNYNTAWVEGWANAFGAYNNGGMVFNVDLKQTSSLSFLKDKTLDQCARNELFVGKVVYDLMKNVEGGQAAVYEAFAKSAPHSSLYQFCNEYVSLYPENKAALAEILIANSQGNATLDDILLYVNGGSRTVSRDLYNYLVKAGLINSNGTQTASNQQASNNTSTKKQGLFSRIINWFSNLFNFNKVKETIASATGKSASSPDSIFDTPLDGNLAVKGSVSSHISASSPNIETVIDDGSINGLDTMGLTEAQNAYNKYLAEYNQMVNDSNADKKKLNETILKMHNAKNKIRALQSK